MKESKTYGLAVAIVLLMAACNTSLPFKEYMAWVKDGENGLHLSKTVNGFTFDLQYLPAPFRFVTRHDSRSPQDLARFVAQQQDMQYFNLTISAENGADLVATVSSDESYRQQMLYYLSYNFQQDIFLEVCGQQIPCTLYHFERSYDMKSSRTCVLGFKSPCADADALKLVIDPEILPTGPVKIKMITENIPELKL